MQGESMTRPSCDSTGTGGVALDMDRAGAAQRHATAEFRWDREFADSPLEGGGFEPSVPRRMDDAFETPFSLLRHFPFRQRAIDQDRDGGLEALSFRR
jgi:hypothetical protein